MLSRQDLLEDGGTCLGHVSLELAWTDHRWGILACCLLESILSNRALDWTTESAWATVFTLTLVCLLCIFISEVVKTTTELWLLILSDFFSNMITFDLNWVDWPGCSIKLLLTNFWRLKVVSSSGQPQISKWTYDLLHTVITILTTRLLRWTWRLHRLVAIFEDHLFWRYSLRFFVLFWLAFFEFDRLSFDNWVVFHFHFLRALFLDLLRFFLLNALGLIKNRNLLTNAALSLAFTICVLLAVLLNFNLGVQIKLGEVHHLVKIDRLAHGMASDMRLGAAGSNWLIVLLTWVVDRKHGCDDGCLFRRSHFQKVMNCCLILGTLLWNFSKTLSLDNGCNLLCFKNWIKWCLRTSIWTGLKDSFLNDVLDLLSILHHTLMSLFLWTGCLINEDLRLLFLLDSWNLQALRILHALFRLNWLRYGSWCLLHLAKDVHLAFRAFSYLVLRLWLWLCWRSNTGNTKNLGFQGGLWNLTRKEIALVVRQSFQRTLHIGSIFSRLSLLRFRW